MRRCEIQGTYGFVQFHKAFDNADKSNILNRYDGNTKNNKL